MSCRLQHCSHFYINHLCSKRLKASWNLNECLRQILSIIHTSLLWHHYVKHCYSQISFLLSLITVRRAVELVSVVGIDVDWPASTVNRVKVSDVKLRVSLSLPASKLQIQSSQQQQPYNLVRKPRTRFHTTYLREATTYTSDARTPLFIYHFSSHHNSWNQNQITFNSKYTF